MSYRAIAVTVLIAAAIPFLAGAAFPEYDIFGCGSGVDSLWFLIVPLSVMLVSAVAAFIIGVTSPAARGLGAALGLVLVVGVAGAAGLIVGPALGGCSLIDDSSVLFVLGAGLLIAGVGAVPGWLIGFVLGSLGRWANRRAIRETGTGG